MHKNKVVSSGTKARIARKAAPVAARGGAKVAKASGRHAIRGAKTEARLAKAALSSREPRSARYTKYALFAVAGLAFGALLGRIGGKQGETSASFTGGTGAHAPQSGSPAAERGQTWGTGSSVGAAGGASAAANYQTPGEANQIGADREFSDPASGPLIGEGGHPGLDMTERNQIIEQQIRTAIGEQIETEGMPKINVEVNDGVVDIRGPVPSEDTRRKIGEIAASTDGVREVRNELTVADV